MRRNLPKTRSIKRSHGKVVMPPVLVAVCEGKTEKVLLDELRGHWRIPSAHVFLVGQAGVPSVVVRRAKRERREHLKVASAKRHGEVELWVVFDRDAHPCWKQAIVEARQAGMKLAVSNPCFEQWALLLHEDQHKNITNKDAQRRLSKVHPRYHHDKRPYLDLETVLRSLKDARRRAHTINRAAADAGDSLGAPSTTFSDLVDRLEGLALTALA